MKKIAFLTKAELDDFTCDDHLAVPALQELGYKVEHINWHNKEDWSRFEAVIVRSTWDYQDHYEEFVKVLTDINSKTKLFNDLEQMKWNSHKGYLKELQSKGIKIIPTVFHEQMKDLNVDELCKILKTEKIIFKPYVGANSDNTFPCVLGDPLPKANIHNGHFFAQSFNKNILDEGEYSLFYFNGVFSHAILKTPKPGDYRVQEEWGGEISSIIPEESLLKTADNIARKDLLYCRVDLVRSGDEFHLMELELIEPALYFRTSKGSEEVFAQAVISRLS